jgi:hypothetical protein
MNGDITWIALFLLGCYHGINPGMGWLFAVALGLQERRLTAVLRAIVPLALGHVLSVAIIAALALFAAAELPHVVVQRVSAGVLLAFAVYRLARARHLRWVGMQVGFWGLALWGFLMSTAHGAGLMLVPFLTANAHYPTGLLMVGVHTFGYLLTLTAVALVVYVKFGVSFLRSAWFNLDVVWAAALFITGIVALIA